MSPKLLFRAYRHCAIDLVQMVDLNRGIWGIALDKNPFSRRWEQRQRLMRKIDYRLSLALGEDHATTCQRLGILTAEDLSP